MAGDLTDGFGMLLDGMNLGIEPEDLPASQFARGVNIVARKGHVGTRPRYSKYNLTDAAKTGVFQGAYRYQLNAHEYIAWVMSGRIYMLDLTDGDFFDYSTDFGVGLGVGRQCYFVKAEKYLIIQDGLNPGIIIDGETSARQSNQAANELPIGTLMVYGHSRLFVVPTTYSGEDGRRFILAGNICLPSNVANLLKFTETWYLANGGALSMPEESGFIGAMGFMYNNSTGNGYGPMIVIARRGGAAFAVNQPRETLADGAGVIYRQGWTEIDIRQMIFSDVGSASPFALLPLNADLLFRGTKDGVRSLSITVSEINSTLRNVSLSGEMQDVYDLGRDALLGQVSSAFSDNRILFTVIPDEDDATFKGVTSLDMAVVNNVKNKLPPAYDGVFTGGRWLQILTAEYDGRDRMFAFTKTATGIELVYEDDDALLDMGTTPPECRLYTKTFTYGSPVKRKHLNHVRVWVSGIHGDVTLSVYARSDNYPFWVQLDKTATFQAPTTGRAQQRRDVVFSANESMVDAIEKEDGLVGYGHQLAFVWTGKMKLRQAFLIAEVRSPPNLPANKVAEENTVLTDVGQLDIEAADYEYRW